MAQSRLEKIGTIFTRVSGLLRGGAMKVDDKPIWYDVYSAFQPKLKPQFDRPALNVPIRNIFYDEDFIRSKYHKSTTHLESINIADNQRKTQTQQFIKIYNDLKSQGPLDDDQIFESSKKMLNMQRQQNDRENYNLKLNPESNVPDNVTNVETLKQTNTINIQNLFKDS